MLFYRFLTKSEMRAIKSKRSKEDLRSWERHYTAGQKAGQRSRLSAAGGFQTAICMYLCQRDGGVCRGQSNCI